MKTKKTKLNKKIPLLYPVARSYIINPSEVQDRVGKEVYARVAKQIKKWKPVLNQNSTDMIGNVGMDLAYDKAKKKFCFKERTFGNWDEFPPISSVMSSALFLYRLLCHFEPKIEIEPITDRYKCIWWIKLRHKQSGEILQFGEWKGAAGIWTKYDSHIQLPAAFKQDLLLLLDELCAKDCPHPYDGLVAGSVA